MKIIDTIDYAKQRKLQHDFYWMLSHGQMLLHHLGEFTYYTPYGIEPDHRYSGKDSDTMVIYREGWVTCFAVFDCTESELNEKSLRQAWDKYFEHKEAKK